MTSGDRRRTSTCAFLNGLGLPQGAVVSIIGAGGKTSLMFQLAREARNRGDIVLVTTSTKLLHPRADQYDAIDLSGHCFKDQEICSSGIYIAGRPANIREKIIGCEQPILEKNINRFDLVLIEADGAARKPLKGWSATEPVIVPFTSHTIGVLDLSTLSKSIDENLVHRLKIFTELTESCQGDLISLQHFHKLITHERGMFAKARGKRILYLNKAESPQIFSDFQSLYSLLPQLHVTAGSIQQNKIYTKTTR